MVKSNKSKQKETSIKFVPVLTRLRRYFFLEAKITPKLDIPKKEAIELYLKYTNNQHINHSKSNFIIEDYNNKTSPVFDTRAIRERSKV